MGAPRCYWGMHRGACQNHIMRFFSSQTVTAASENHATELGTGGTKKTRGHLTVPSERLTSFARRAFHFLDSMERSGGGVGLDGAVETSVPTKEGDCLLAVSLFGPGSYSA